MTNSSVEMLALAERAEAATEPVRELDCAAALIVGWQDVRNEGYGARRGVRPSTGKREHIPRYTASLDAAMTLVPEGLDFGCGRGIDTELGANKAICYAWVGEGAGDLVFAETTALALTAASLRAHAGAAHVQPKEPNT